MFLFPRFIIMMQYVLQLFSDLVYHEHHIIIQWMIIFQGGIDDPG